MRETPFLQTTPVLRSQNGGSHPGGGVCEDPLRNQEGRATNNQVVEIGLRGVLRVSDPSGSRRTGERKTGTREREGKVVGTFSAEHVRLKSLCFRLEIRQVRDPTWYHSPSISRVLGATLVPQTAPVGPEGRGGGGDE